MTGFRNIFVITCLMLGAQAGSIANNIVNHKDNFDKTETTQLFKKHPNIAGSSDDLTGGELLGGTFLDRESAADSAEEQEGPDYMVFVIPRDDDEDMTLHLYHASIYGDDAHVCNTVDDIEDCKTPGQGKHYWGIVADHPEDSLAACSIAAEEVGCLIQLGGEQFVLGNLHNSTSEVFYNTKDLAGSSAYEHSDNHLYTPGSGTQSSTFAEIKESVAAVNNEKVVQLYVEVENDIYKYFGEDEAKVLSWVEEIFAEVFILYANDDISMTLKTVKIWKTQDPYPETDDSFSKIDAFAEHLNGKFDGDLAHLISFDGGGGVAWMDSLCQKQFGYAYSGVSESYSEAPLYSWTVEVLAHELGHNLGSPHTHSCTWGPNHDKPIDCCGAIAGYNECGLLPSTCEGPQRPENGGSIMSYCHLTITGIRFTNGFGAEPAALMRQRIADAECLEPFTGCMILYEDKDGDGKGNPEVSIEVCHGDKPEGYVRNELDCDDNDDTKSQGLTCYDPVLVGCVGSWNEQCVCDYPQEWVVPWYPDTDGDGYGDPGSEGIIACDAPIPGYVDNDWDCDPNDPKIHPDIECPAEGGCIGYMLRECECYIWDDEANMTWYQDLDGDGKGNVDVQQRSCVEVEGYVLDGYDCDDSDPTKWKHAPCDAGPGCEGEIDWWCRCQPTKESQWYYPDADGDGLGDHFDWGMGACEAPEGYVTNNNDCDDYDSSAYMGSICADPQGCVSTYDENCHCIADADAAQYWYLDRDQDGYGEYYESVVQCGQPHGYVDNPDDCDDYDATVWTGATCVDDFYAECIGQLDNWCSCKYEKFEYWYDHDKDGYGNKDDWVKHCVRPEGYVENDLDPDDDDPSNPGGTYCNYDIGFDFEFIRASPHTPEGSTTATFNAPIRNPSFTVLNLGSKAGKFEELVTVLYTKNGEEHEFGTMVYDELKSINEGLPRKQKNDWKVEIPESGITEIRVLLKNNILDSSKRVRVDLTEIDYQCVEDETSGETAFVQRGESLPVSVEN